MNNETSQSQESYWEKEAASEVEGRKALKSYFECKGKIGDFSVVRSGPPLLFVTDKISLTVLDEALDCIGNSKASLEKAFQELERCIGPLLLSPKKIHRFLKTDRSGNLEIVEKLPEVMLD